MKDQHALTLDDQKHSSKDGGPAGADDQKHGAEDEGPHAPTPDNQKYGAEDKGSACADA